MDEFTNYQGKYTGADIDNAIGKIQGSNFSNPNLLDNWYFADPVNQRGQTNYTERTGYTIDRWYSFATAGVSVTDEGLVVTGATDNASRRIYQKIEAPQKLNGKTVTYSVLFNAMVSDKTVIGLYNETANVFYGGRAYADFTGVGLLTVTGAIPEEALSSSTSLMAMIYPDNAKEGASCTVLAAKLELGSVQTLARQDANGNWVLNDPPPDKGVETLKCCMSTADSSDPYANNKAPARYGLGVFANDITSWKDDHGQGFYSSTVDGPILGYYWHGFINSLNYYNRTVIVFHPTYGMCRLEKVNGTWGNWEFFNPPMQLGVEYRTTERWNGKPVYARAFDFGAVGVGGQTAKSIGTYLQDEVKLDHIEFTDPNATGDTSNKVSGQWDAVPHAIAYAKSGNGNIIVDITTTSSFIAGMTAVAYLKYTKRGD